MKQTIRSVLFVTAFLATGVVWGTPTIPGQAQGQAQAQAQAVVINATPQLTSNSSSLIQNNIQPTQGNTQQSDTVVNTNTTTNHARPAASTAFAAPLTSGIDTCMGSTSAGVQALGVGLSVGSTWVDENCKRLKNSRELRSMGYSEAALALMCQDPAVALAMRTVGTPCPVLKEER